MPNEQLKQKDFFDPDTEKNDDNIYWVDKYVSGTPDENGVFESKKIKEADLFKVVCGVFTSDKTFELAGYKAIYNNAEFKIIAAADTSADNLFLLTKSDGTTSIIDVRGNGQMAFNGALDTDYKYTYITTGHAGGALFSKSDAGINIRANGNNSAAFNQADSHTVAQWFGDGAATIGVWGRATSGTGVKAETTGAGLALEVIGKSKITGLNTYADNATASAALGGADHLYIRTGHGLDITV